MTYYIPEHNISKFEQRISRLSKRAAKLGSKITWKVDSSDFKDEEHTSLGRDFRTRKVWVRRVRVDVDGDIPHYAGWQFIGTVEHTDDGNVMRTIPGAQAPSRYRDTPPICEHCKLQRFRKDTYLLKHETLGVVQVGSGCLKDFLGHGSPQTLAQAASVWVSVDDLAHLCEDERGFSGSGGSNREDLMTFLGYVAEITLRDGFWSRAAVERLRAARGDHAKVPQATAARAASFLRPTSEEDYEEALRYEPGAAAVELATRARSWVLDTFGCGTPADDSSSDIVNFIVREPRSDLSDFEHNLLVVAKGESCEHRTFGIAAYIVQAFRNATEPQNLKRASRRESNHVSAPGQKLTLDATCVNVASWASPYGETTLFKLVTPNGDVLVWRASQVSDVNTMEIGKSYTVKATVKGHSDYNGMKQTELSRVKVLLGLVGSTAPASVVA